MVTVSMPQFWKIYINNPAILMHAVELIPNHAIHIDICAIANEK